MKSNEDGSCSTPDTQNSPNTPGKEESKTLVPNTVDVQAIKTNNDIIAGTDFGSTFEQNS